jgi:hypothetical protein
MLEKVPRRLSEAINGSIERKDQVMTAVKTRGLMNEDMLIPVQFCMNKRSRDVSLRRAKTKFSGENHHSTDSTPLDDWRPSLKEVDSLSLHIATHTKPGFKLLD